jgi:hypothetical protein
MCLFLDILILQLKSSLAQVGKIKLFVLILAIHNYLSIENSLQAIYNILSI